MTFYQLLDIFGKIGLLFEVHLLVVSVLIVCCVIRDSGSELFTEEEGETAQSPPPMKSIGAVLKHLEKLIQR